MGFFDEIKSAAENVKNAAAKQLPPTENNVAKLNERFSQMGFKSKPIVALETFRESPDGPEMQRIAIGGRLKRDEIEAAKAAAKEIVGDRWVSDDAPTAQAAANAKYVQDSGPAAVRSKIQARTDSRGTHITLGGNAGPTQQGKTATEHIGGAVTEGVAGAKNVARQADQAIGNAITDISGKLGSLFRSDEPQAPRQGGPAGPR